MTATVTDLYCGGGGSSNGAVRAGAELVFALNHWDRAIETHNHNHPQADHARVDVKHLTERHIRRFPDSTILIASPECRNHSLAKGALARKEKAETLFGDSESLAVDAEVAELGPGTLDETERSRATMNDVARFAEQKELKGSPYAAIVVENVVDALRWGVGNDGRHFRRWLKRILAVGYEHEIVFLNSMFCPPAPTLVPQSRDRMYVVFWRRGMRCPDLTVSPPSWCSRCNDIVAGLQTWKKRDREPWGRYGQQYIYTCPGCYATVVPGAAPASEIIDYSLPTPSIGGRAKPLKTNTRERIRRGLERLGSESFSLRLLRKGTPRPLTLPLASRQGRHDMGMVLPVSGNTHEATPGNRARRAEVSPLFTVHGSLDRGLVMANTEHGVPRPAVLSPTQTLRTEGGLSLVTRTGHKGANGGLSRDGDTDPVFGVTTAQDLVLVMGNRTNGVPKDADSHPVPTACTGSTLGVVVSNYSPGWTRDAERAPIGSVTTTDGHSLVVPYYRGSVPFAPETGPSPTLTTRDRLALLVPPEHYGGDQVRETRRVTDEELDACGFRMFSLPEIARAMSMEVGADDQPYTLFGNKRERMKLLGNAVTPPAMKLLIERLLVVLDEQPV